MPRCTCSTLKTRSNCDPFLLRKNKVGAEESSSGKKPGTLSWPTLFGSTAVSFRARIGRPLGVLRQVILPRPIKVVASVLGETTYPLILETAHVIWG